MTMKEFADVSVVIPTYNSENVLERAVKSVLSQILLPKEIIIVDDCSTSPNSKAIIKNISKKYSNICLIKIVFFEKNLGPGSARNAGMNIATGKYIAFLDSDDIWHPQKIYMQYNFMKNNPDVFFTSHPLYLVDCNDEIEFNTRLYNYNELKLYKLDPIKLLYRHCDDGTVCVMIKNDSNYRFMNEKRYSEDYLLWQTILFRNKGVYLNLPLSAVFKPTYGVAGLSSNLWRMEKGELETYKKLREYNFINLAYYLSACLFSIIKFLRRCVKSYLYRVK